MKKLLMAMALACAAMVASAEDSFLYWMVDVGDSTGYAFNYATIKAKDASGNESGYLWLYRQDSADKIGQKLVSSNYGKNGSYDPGTTTGGGAFAGVGSYGVGSKFLFELWTDGETADSPNRVGWTGWIDYSKLAENIFAGNIPGAGASPFTVGATMLAPEPTGGLLTLLGWRRLRFAASRRSHKKIPQAVLIISMTRKLRREVAKNSAQSSHFRKERVRT